MTMPWSFATVEGTIKINDDEKCQSIVGNFNHRADGAVQCRVQCKLSKCLGGDAPVAAMVNKFGEKHKTLLASYLMVASSAKKRDFELQKGPSTTHVIDAASFVKM